MLLQLDIARREFVTEALDITLNLTEIMKHVKSDRAIPLSSKAYKQLETYLRNVTGKLVAVKAPGPASLTILDVNHLRNHNTMPIIIESDREFRLTAKDKEVIEQTMTEWAKGAAYYRRGQSSTYIYGATFKNSFSISAATLPKPKSGMLFPITQVTAIYIER